MSDGYSPFIGTRFEDAPLHLRAHAFGVDYLCIDDDLGGSMYVTRYGWPFLEHLRPDAWWEGKRYLRDGWRITEGSGAVYRVPSRKPGGARVDLVLKFSRFAQDVPLQVADQFPDDAPREAVERAYFLSPFEEFGAVVDLRHGAFGPRGLRVLTKRPLAIYRAPPSYAMWRLGRHEWQFYRHASRLQQDQARRHGPRLVELDADHEYVLLFAWVDGENAAEYARRGLLDEADLEALTERVIGEMRLKGFRVLDQKPAHFILRERRPGELLRRRDGRLAYALVDFELLERTPEYEAWLKQREQTDISDD